MLCFIIILNSCSRSTTHFLQVNNSQQLYYTDYNIANNNSDTSLKQSEIYLANNNDELKPYTDSNIPYSTVKRNEVIPIKSSVKKTLNKPANQNLSEEPVKGNKKKNGFAILGFILSIISLLLLLPGSPLIIATLSLAVIFNILGSKSELKKLPIISWAILGCIAVIGLYILIVSLLYI